VRVTHWPPTRNWGFGGRFWGLEGSNGVRFWCLGSQMKAYFVWNAIKAKQKFWVTPNFQGPWFSILGPQGFMGSVFYFKYASFFKIQTWGSENGAPYPEIGVQKICLPERIFLWWSDENIPQIFFCQTLSVTKYSMSPKWTWFGYPPWGRPPNQGNFLNGGFGIVSFVIYKVRAFQNSFCFETYSCFTFSKTCFKFL
jgi:hypothetical protein